MHCYSGEITFVTNTDGGWGYIMVPRTDSSPIQIEFKKKHLSNSVPFEKLRPGSKVKIFTAAPLGTDKPVQVEKVEPATR